MCENNPAYLDLVDGLRRALGVLRVPDGANILDIGSGTGNISLALAKLFPNCTIHHLERNPGMNAVAARKFRAAAIDNIRIIESDALAYIAQSDRDFALVSCIHCLYAMDAPEQVLAGLRRRIAADGYFYICDIARTLDIDDWRRYVFLEIVRSKGLLSAIRLFWKGRIVSSQNRNIEAAQRNGVYWVRSTAETARTCQQAGFDIDWLRTAYRGYSDEALCRPSNATAALALPTGELP